MRNLICGLFLLSVGLAAQSNSEDETDRSSVARLDSILLTLRHEATPAVSRQLTETILSFAENYHKPTRATVLKFSEELTRGLASRELPEKVVSQVSTSIVEVLGSAGVGTFKFRGSVDRARQALVTIGLAEARARSIAELLRMIGKEVRGPEDMPLERVRFLILRRP